MAIGSTALLLALGYFLNPGVIGGGTTGRDAGCGLVPPLRHVRAVA